MPKERMRWQILLDVPVNVSTQEYTFYSLHWLGLSMCFLGALGTLFAAATGVAKQTIGLLESVPALSVAEAAAVREDIPSVRLEGTLVAEGPMAMPDEPGLEVALGRLQLAASIRSNAGEQKSAILYEWEHAPTALWLESDGARVRLSLDLETIPRSESRSPVRATRISDGTSARTSRTLGFEFLGEARLLPDDWNRPRTVSVEIERSFVANHSPFVVTGQLMISADGTPTLSAGTSDSIMVQGTMEEIRTGSEERGKLHRLAWVPLLLCGVWLLRRTLRTRREFVVRSNER